MVFKVPSNQLSLCDVFQREKFGSFLNVVSNLRQPIGEFRRDVNRDSRQWPFFMKPCELTPISHYMVQCPLRN